MATALSMAAAAFLLTLSLGYPVLLLLKFVVLGLIARGAAFALWHSEMLGIDYTFVPGFADRVELGWLIVPLAWLAIVATAHAVNLTDGLDGLAGHTAAVAF